MSNDKAVLLCRNLGKRYEEGPQSVEVLAGVELALQPGERVVTLEVHGKPWSTEQLAVELDRWRLDARTVNLMVGGPEGLAPEVCARSEQRWSLSPLTLPHPLVRVLLGEQIYRAWTVLSGHPYHK